MSSLPLGRSLAVILVFAFAAGCSTSDDPSSDAAPVDENTDVVIGQEPAGIRLVTPEAGAEIQEGDIVVLDVRTPDEFADGHLEGARMIDFYSPDFADQLAELDPEASYLLYCRSGNRSGRTTEIMADLGFTDVADVDGGILAWTAAGLPVVE